MPAFQGYMSVHQIDNYERVQRIASRTISLLPNIDFYTERLSKLGMTTIGEHLNHLTTKYVNRGHDKNIMVITNCLLSKQSVYRHSSRLKDNYRHDVRKRDFKTQIETEIRRNSCLVKYFQTISCI